MARKRTGAVCQFCGAQGLAWWHDTNKMNLDGTRGGYRLTLPARDPVTGEPQYNTQEWTDKTSGVKRSVQRLVPDTTRIHKCLQQGAEQHGQGQRGADTPSPIPSPEQTPEDDASEDVDDADDDASDGGGGRGKGAEGSELSELDQELNAELDEHLKGQGSEGESEDGQDAPEDGAQDAPKPPRKAKQGDKGQPLTDAARKAQDLAKALQAMASEAMDEKRVREIAADEAKKAQVGKTQSLKLKVQQQGREPVEIDGAHPLQSVLVSLLHSRIHVYLYGPRGSGKTTGAMLAAKALRLDYGYISLNPQTADSRVNGFLDAHGTFRDTVFVQRYRDGGVMCVDEMDHASGNILTALNGAIENGHASFPCGMVPRHPDFVLVATGNTPGRGPTPDHPERRGFDGATGDRFAYLYWPFDTTVEENATLAEHPQGAVWLAWIRAVREYAAQNDPRLIVSPRASIMGARIIASGALDSLPSDKTRQTMLADAVLFKGWDKDTISRIMNACPMPSYRDIKGA